MRLAIASILEWCSSWLSCYADRIGQPELYAERLRLPSLGELWHSFRLHWQTWHGEPTG